MRQTKQAGTRAGFACLPSSLLAALARRSSFCPTDYAPCNLAVCRYDDTTGAALLTLVMLTCLVGLFAANVIDLAEVLHENSSEGA